MMLAILFAMTGIETWVAGFGKTQESYQTLGRIGLALPYVTAAALGIIFLLATRGSLAIQSAGLGVLLGGLAVAVIGALRETTRVMSFAGQVPEGQIGNYLDFYTLGGSVVALGSALFGLKVAMRGNMAFGSTGPKRLSGARAVHGANDWMSDAQAAKLFPASGGIVVGENYRPDKDTVGQVGFDPRRKDTWGKGGKAPLLCFDAGFGSTHGLVFAGSGGFKTTSVVIPTALKFKGTLIVLDPSTEIAPMVTSHRRENYQRVFTLDPPETRSRVQCPRLDRAARQLAGGRYRLRRGMVDERKAACQFRLR